MRGSSFSSGTWTAYGSSFLASPAWKVIVGWGHVEEEKMNTAFLHSLFMKLTCCNLIRCSDMIWKLAVLRQFVILILWNFSGQHRGQFPIVTCYVICIPHSEATSCCSYIHHPQKVAQKEWIALWICTNDFLLLLRNNLDFYPYLPLEYMFPMVI